MLEILHPPLRQCLTIIDIPLAIALLTPPNHPSTPKQATATAQSSTRQRGFWATLSASFTAILLAEMGDKTQLATLLIAAESQSPLTVFAGAALALIGTSFIGVLVGVWLARHISPQVMDLAAAAILLVLAVLLLWDVVQA